MGGFIILIGFGSALAYIPLQVYAVWLTRGAWRYAALVPVPFALLVAIYTLVGYLQHSNLWPICMIFTAPLGVIYLTVLCTSSAVRHEPQRDPVRCASCKYDLTGLPRPGKCPECGTPFESEQAV